MGQHYLIQALGHIRTVSRDGAQRQKSPSDDTSVPPFPTWLAASFKQGLSLYVHTASSSVMRFSREIFFKSAKSSADRNKTGFCEFRETQKTVLERISKGHLEPYS